MSRSIWTQCADNSSIHQVKLEAIRIVETQTQIATLKLVDSIEEAEILDSCLEKSKPPLPEDDFSSEKLVYTPFRYPPLKHGSRFGRRHERGIWYGAKDLLTDFYEVIYYRWLFREQSPELKSFEQTFSMTSFCVSVKSDKFVNLTQGKFENFETEISAKDSYRKSQPLGTEMRKAGIEAFAYISARAPGRQLNYGVFSPRVISSEPDQKQKHWNIIIKTDLAIVFPFDSATGKTFEISRAYYLVKNKFPVIR